MNKYSIIALAIYLSLTAAAPSNAGVLDWFRSKPLGEAIKENLQSRFNTNRQQIFKSFHPVGTATSIEVHNVQIAWKNPDGAKNLNNMAGFAVRFTIYWRGPLTADGFTKVVAAFDNESKRYLESKILATNGVSNAETANAAANFLGGLLEGMMSDK